MGAAVTLQYVSLILTILDLDKKVAVVFLFFSY